METSQADYEYRHGCGASQTLRRSNEGHPEVETYSANPDELDTERVHAPTIGNMPSLERFQAISND
jgi:hypothetical protein